MTERVEHVEKFNIWDISMSCFNAFEESLIQDSHNVVVQDLYRLIHDLGINNFSDLVFFYEKNKENKDIQLLTFLGLKALCIAIVDGFFKHHCCNGMLIIDSKEFILKELKILGIDIDLSEIKNPYSSDLENLDVDCSFTIHLALGGPLDAETQKTAKELIDNMG